MPSGGNEASVYRGFGAFRVGVKKLWVELLAESDDFLFVMVIRPNS
jgi:hypothetical protein